MSITRLEDDISLDFETFSEADLRKTGAHRYAQDASTTALCMAWATYRQEPQLWRPGMDCPDELVDHILFGGRVRAWNAVFERLMFKHVMGPRFGWPIPSDDQYVCTMTEALAMGLPGALANAAPALGLDIKKDDAGSRIMMQLCKPRRPTKTNKSLRWERHLVPHKYEQLETYCAQDVRVEAACAERLVRLHDREQDFYTRDLRIQDRGLYIDRPFVRQAHLVVDQQLKKLDDEMREATDNAVASTSAAKQLVSWLATGGILWPEGQPASVAKDAVLKLLVRDDLTEGQRKALLIRQEAAKTSTAKLDKIEGLVCEDGRLRGSLQFHGASTGRDAARGAQFQNLPRPSKSTNVPEAIKTIMRGDAELVELIHGAPMSIVADCLRGTIIAAPGSILYTRDASQIEARMTAWLGNEQKVLDAFRRFDGKEGPDLYRIAAAGIFNVPVDKVDDVMRSVGKVAVLALGFGGGAGAFGSMAKLYNVNLLTMFDTVWGIAEDDDREKALEAWKQRGSKSGVSKKGWIASELVKIAWRRDNANIAQTWKDYENAAVEAILRPGEKIRVRQVWFRKTGSFLRCVLPSGRSLFFPYPRLESTKTPWGKDKWTIYYKAVDGATKRFREWSLWGGLLFQNVVQATARDYLFEKVVALEEAGYPNVLRVHDETISETPEDFGSEEEFHRLFVQPPLWAPDLPVAADGWRGVRYKK